LSINKKRLFFITLSEFWISKYQKKIFRGILSCSKNIPKKGVSSEKLTLQICSQDLRRLPHLLTRVRHNLQRKQGVVKRKNLKSGFFYLKSGFFIRPRRAVPSGQRV